MPDLNLAQLGQLVFGALGIFDQQRLEEERNRRDESRFQEIKGLRFEDLERLDREQSGIEGGFLERRSRALQTLQGAGDQERRDIQRRFGGIRGDVQQDLVSRGLTASTVASSAAAEIGRQESDALGRLEESLRQQRLVTDAELFGDFLLARERGTGRRLDVRENLERFIERKTEIPGQSTALALSQLAESLNPPPKPEEPETDLFSPSIAALATIIAAGL